MYTPMMHIRHSIEQLELYRKYLDEQEEVMVKTDTWQVHLPDWGAKEGGDDTGV
eukprot:TRINITY_DN5001_c0_g1_i1.p3 TRINITY_DN5001_c0_g1~~TRINITY_DN5001_c0_g1_i1.p3  ORF type:complete len:54 (+),score=7.31 TRINITY_DN5001_c0_g1_i1:164-325(+)